MNKERIITIMERAKAKQATDAELQELAEALDRDMDGSVTSQMEEWLEQGRLDVTLPTEERANGMLADILEAGKALEQTPDPETPVKVIPFRRYGKIAAAAAAVVLLAGVSYFFWPQNPQPGPAVVSTAPGKPAQEGLPAGKKAVLTLANGSNVTLDEQNTDTITRQGNTNIVNKEEGRLVYEPGNTAPAGLSLINKITVPRGGQYQVDLADGSRVWLNAASSLRFPVDFPGNERVVELEGEAYFEVAPKARQPFIVKAGQTTVQVLGTHFNVSAYGDEISQKTTLLEGKVRVQAGNARYELLPGQQVIFDKKGASSRLIKNANTEEAVAWKNGYFQFSGADAVVLLREISRWYNIEVVYNEVPAGYELNGKIDRNIRLSSVVTALREGGIRCTLEGNRLIVGR